MSIDSETDRDTAARLNETRESPVKKYEELQTKENAKAMSTLEMAKMQLQQAQNFRKQLADQKFIDQMDELAN